MGLPPNNRIDDKTELEIENGLRQFDVAVEYIDNYLDPERPFSFSPNLILDLHKAAMAGVKADAGMFRSGEVEITASAHKPPPNFTVNNHVRDMCETVNDHWHEWPPFKLCAYVMWRLNWIHPFSDGNGRTSRMAAYVILNASLGYRLPGALTVPQQIEQDGSWYIKGLVTADEADRNGKLDFREMEEMLKSMLAKQLLGVIEHASGEELSQA